MTAFKPIIPPGSPLQRTLPGRNPKLVVTVFAILAVHVLLLSGLLIQGCKRDDKNAAGTSDTDTNSSASLPPLPSAPGSGAGETVRTPPSPDSSATSGARLPTLPPAPIATPAPPAPAESTSAVVVATEPNPAAMTKNADAPALGSHGPASTHSAGMKPATADGPITVYTVKVGDNLTRIARAHGTTPKAIREASGLKTDRILVGQKLKVPTSSAASTGSKETAVTKADTTAK